MAGERVEKIQRLVLRAAAHARRGIERPSVREHRQGLRELALLVVEESEAPLDRRPQGALALGQVARSRAQGVENVFESVEQRGGWKHSGASRGELDREGKPVEAPADLRDRRSVRVVQREVVANRPRPVHEETHRGKRRDLVERRPFGECRHRQRLDRVIPLSAESQQGAARGEDRDVGAHGEELIELGCRAGHLLEVVEHQQRRGRREVLDQGVERRARAFDRRTHRRGNSGQHERGIRDRRERDELRAASGFGERGADCDREPGLADASWPGQRDQPHVG